MKRGKLEGFGGRKHRGETEYQTAMREFVEEVANTFQTIDSVWESEIPQPRYVFVAQGGYINFVYTYDDYEIIATVLEKHDICIPKTIKDVLSTQVCQEHDFITQLSFDPEKLSEIKTMIHDYFYRDICMLDLVITKHKYTNLVVTFKKTESNIKFFFTTFARHFNVYLEEDNFVYEIKEMECDNEQDKSFIRDYIALVLPVKS